MASFCNQIWRFPKMGLSHIIQKITMTIEIPWWFSWGSPQKPINPGWTRDTGSIPHPGTIRHQWRKRIREVKTIKFYPDDILIILMLVPTISLENIQKKSYPHESEKWSLGWFFRFHIPLNHPNDHHQQWYSTIPSYHQSLLGWFIINSKWYLLVN